MKGLLLDTKVYAAFKRGTPVFSSSFGMPRSWFFALSYWPIILAARALAGWGREAPKCGGPVTLELVKRVIVDQFREEHKNAFKPTAIGSAATRTAEALP